MNERKETRFPVEAGATVEVRNNGRIVRATTVNGSGCGVLLEFEESVQLAISDQVSCDFSIADSAEKPLPCWGLGNVVRVEGRSVAIEFKAGGHYPSESQADCAPLLENSAASNPAKL
jgi:hypothetical protein